MIKINLISAEPSPAATRKKGPEISLGAHQGDIILVTVLVISLLIAGGRWYMLYSTIQELNATRIEKEKQRDELKQYIKTANELEAKRAELKKKIDTIRELKENQQGPVHVMDEISRALPDLVWLKNLTLNGKKVQIVGMALDVNAIANFSTNLKASPYVVSADVLGYDLVTSSSAYTFQVTCTFTNKPAQIKSVKSGSGS